MNRSLSALPVTTSVSLARCRVAVSMLTHKQDTQYDKIIQDHDTDIAQNDGDVDVEGCVSRHTSRFKKKVKDNPIKSLAVFGLSVACGLVALAYGLGAFGSSEPSKNHIERGSVDCNRAMSLSAHTTGLENLDAELVPNHEIFPVCVFTGEWEKFEMEMETKFEKLGELSVTTESAMQETDVTTEESVTVNSELEDGPGSVDNNLLITYLRNIYNSVLMSFDEVPAGLFKDPSAIGRNRAQLEASLNKLSVFEQSDVTVAPPTLPDEPYVKAHGHEEDRAIIYGVLRLFQMDTETIYKMWKYNFKNDHWFQMVDSFEKLLADKEHTPFDGIAATGIRIFSRAYDEKVKAILAKNIVYSDKVEDKDETTRYLTTSSALLRELSAEMAKGEFRDDNVLASIVFRVLHNDAMAEFEGIPMTDFPNQERKDFYRSELDKIAKSLNEFPHERYPMIDGEFEAEDTLELNLWTVMKAIAWGVFGKKAL